LIFTFLAIGQRSPLSSERTAYQQETASGYGGLRRMHLNFKFGGLRQSQNDKDVFKSAAIFKVVLGCNVQYH